MDSTTIKSFVKGYLALVKGDNETAQAEKSFRYAKSALTSQISKMEGDIIAKEEKLTDAKEYADKALLGHGSPLTEYTRDNYVSDLIKSEENVKSAQKALDQHKGTIDFLKEKLAKITADVSGE